MSVLRKTKRKLAGHIQYGMMPDVALGKTAGGDTAVLIQGGAFRTAPGLSFTVREHVEALVEALNDALAEWDEEAA